MPRHQQPQMTNTPPTPVKLTNGSAITGGIRFRLCYEHTNDFQLDVLHARIDNPEMTREEAEEYCLALHKLTGETNEDD